MVSLEYSSYFKKELKRLFKKYKSLQEDVIVLRKSLMENPQQGTDLGKGYRKIRMAISSKGKGKRGGARVITYQIEQKGDDYRICLLMIYDKSEISSVSDRFLSELANSISQK